ncbi:MAG: hypothetical protein ACYSUI_00605 [Planctomycetota bacterium]|jgi:hypothetical protein
MQALHRSRHRFLAGCAGMLLGWIMGATALAQPLLDSVSASPDVTVDLSSTTFADENVAVDNLLGVVVPASLGTLPENAAVTAYHPLDNGDQLFAVDTTAELPGPLVVERRDVVRYDGATYTLEFDGSNWGVPDGAAVDAVSMTQLGQLLLSFDTTVQVGGVIADDEDIVGWDGVSFWLGMDGSFLGIPEALDVDGIHDLQDNRGALSFDGSGVIGGVNFDDEDVLILDFGTLTWSLGYDGSAQHAALAAADVEAVALPEPGQLLMLASGIALLLGLGRRRMRS